MPGVSVARDRAASAAGARVAGIAFHPAWKRRWLLAFAICCALVLMLLVALLALFYEGVGLWGNNIPVTWALDIVGYDWWIGIGCGGLMVSAWLGLSEPGLRAPLDRLAQTIALMAAIGAAIYPIIHLGRPWFFYWNIPYPNRLDLWPQFRSPLVWDAMAILGFLTTAFCLWTTGLLPDLALLRDRADSRWRQVIYGVAALGWRGSAGQWARWRHAQLIFAVCGLLIVVSLQSGAAVMFAGTAEPGWHDALLPVFFLMVAIYSGVAAIALIALLVRAVFDLRDLISARHVASLGLLLLTTGLATTYCYMMSFFATALGGDRYELDVLGRRGTGPYAWSLWIVFACALLPIHLLWSGPLRRSPVALAFVSLLALIGLWMDRFMILVITLHRDFLPSSEHPYAVSLWALATFFGIAGFVGALLLLALRYLPVMAIGEFREGRLRLRAAEVPGE